MKISAKAYAKVNLQLDVLGTRADGYHELAGVMQRISLYDDIDIIVSDSEGAGAVSVSFDEPVPFKNTVRTAAERFLGAAKYDVDISVKKHIPSEAGLGGASADAAAVLTALNKAFAGTELERSEKELFELGLSVGADVPFCMAGGCAVAKGVGEELEKLPVLPMTFVVVKGRKGVSTPRLFGLFDEMYGTESGSRLPEGSLADIIEAIKNGDVNAVAANMKNALQPAAESIAPEIKIEAELLLRCGAIGACMTGSGAAVIGLFKNPTEAELAVSGIKGNDALSGKLFCALCHALE